MKTTVRTSPNIALIKYWGNRDERWRLPAADSLAMVLDTPSVTVDMAPSDTMEVRSYERDGKEKRLSPAQAERFLRHDALVREYLRTIGMEDVLVSPVSITIRSAIPEGIGLASSAAVFAGVAAAYAELIKEKAALTREQISILARLGSGSAARSIHGGFVALSNTDSNGIDGAHARQIADEHHWPLHDIIIAPSMTHKKVGSTEGHALASTSPHWEERLRNMARRQSECIDAITERNFEKLRHVAEEDCMDMHRVMETSTPPLRYLNDETHRIIRDVEDLRRREHLPVLYTMDAGPTVHLFCTREACERVRAYAKEQAGCTVFEAGTGAGAERVNGEER